MKNSNKHPAARAGINLLIHWQGLMPLSKTLFFVSGHGVPEGDERTKSLSAVAAAGPPQAFLRRAKSEYFTSPVNSQ